MKSFKPMLACNADLEKVGYPVLASPKLDGIRCVVLQGRAMSRNLKPIPNDFVRTWLEANCDGLDGELVVGDPTAKDCFQRTTSAVMSKDGQPAFTYYVFDRVDLPDAKFEMRLRCVPMYVEKDGATLCGVVHKRIRTPEALAEYEAARVEEGWEGVMLRDPDGRYKYGRSTVREGGLLKVKRFADAEAVIVDFEERMHNDNAATLDALGHIERSSAKEGKRPAGDLGALVVEMPTIAFGYDINRLPSAIRFTIGSGFTQAQREDFWTRRNELVGQTVKFRYQEVGTKDAPRFPVFAGFRPEGA